MSGHAYTVAIALKPEPENQVVDLVCGHDVVAARIQMMSSHDGEVEHSLGWVVRTSQGMDQVAFWRHLGKSEPWSNQGHSRDVVIESKNLSMSCYEWIEGGLRLVAAEASGTKHAAIVATLFTEGQFALLEVGAATDFQANGEERILSIGSRGSMLRLGGEGYSVGSFVHNGVPVEAGWGLMDEPVDKGIRIATDWVVHYRPIRVLQDIGVTAVDSWNPQGKYPDLITIYQGAVDLPYDEVDTTQAGSNFGISTATYADNQLSSVGYATVSGADTPRSKGWASTGRLIHKISPRVQSVVGTHKDWVRDGWTVELNSQIKANWLAGIWYAPTPASPNVPHETVSGALR